MRIKQISILNEFRCTAGACPANCCRNSWKIPIDLEMYTKYRKEKGFRGILLRCAAVERNNMVTFRNTFRGCPFWDRDRLCGIQKKYGTAYMPAVCIQFPRQLYNLNYFCEETLYLACPETARLFLLSVAEDRPFAFTIHEGSVSYKINTSNDDKRFLDYLLEARDGLIQMLKGGIRYNSMAILNYGRDAQNACLGNTALPVPTEYVSEDRYGINCDKINTLLFQGFYHPGLRLKSPLLYKLCKKYIRKIRIQSRINPDAADRKLEELQKILYQKMPDIDKVLDRYFEYYLLTNFLDIYEDYSFSRHLLFGIVKTEILRLFLALYTESREQTGTEEIATVIAVYERRAPQLRDALQQL